MTNDIVKANYLTLKAPIETWDNAVPLGNGLTGGLLWGQGNQVLLSLDRGDLWDERGNPDVYDEKRNFQTLLQSIQNRDRKTWSKYFDRTYLDSFWTKIPGARLVLTLPESIAITDFNLNFSKGLGTVNGTGGAKLKVFFSAAKSAVLQVPKDSRFHLIQPESVRKLAYEEPVFFHDRHEVSFSQKTADKISYSFVVRWKELRHYTLAVIATGINKDSPEAALEQARRAAGTGLRQGWNRLFQENKKWWQDFHSASSVSIPNSRLQSHYNLVKYYYGAASRSDAPPMPLQGVWTADDGELPPWKGDYHNDLNTQMTYVAWQAAGLTDSGFSYINYFWDSLPQFRSFTKRFYGIDGVMIPGTMTLKGQAMGGWPPYAFSLTNGLWNAHTFYQYWKISGDDTFLKTKAYPFLSEIAATVFSLAKEEDGCLKLPYSSSPEWNSNEWSAYLTPQSNYDQALLLWAADSLVEMAAYLNEAEAAEKWQKLRAKLEPLQVDPDTSALLVAEGIPFEHSHRHFSHALAIYPLALALDTFHIEEAGKKVKATVKQLLENGSEAWVGYSFPWAAALAARARMPEKCLELLRDFEKAYTNRNGFHVNEAEAKTGFSGFQYRPFTLEGNFIFMDAIHEMYLQSWEDKVRIFPAVPDKWKNASYQNLRASGGFKVTARRVAGKTSEVEIIATKDGVLTLEQPFTAAAEWSREFETLGDNLIFKLKAGEKLSGSLVPGGGR